MTLSIEVLRARVNEAGSVRAAARLLGLGESSVRRRLHKASSDEYVVEPAPHKHQPVELLIEERIRKFEALKSGTDSSYVRTVHVRSNETIGIGFFGDPHISNDGANIKKLLDHAALFNGVNKGLYGVLLGDVLDNWVGRLERLWADTSINSIEAQQLLEHFLQAVQWLFVVWGNHDIWNQKVPFYDYLVQANTQISVAHEQRVKLMFPNKREVMIHARHKFPGHSQWTKQFGQIKAAMLGGSADIYVGGDKHVSGYSNGWHDGQKRMWHALQVASYKEIDEYPIELGLAPADLYQCPVAIINPKATSPLNLIRWEFDPNEGAARLAWERKR